MVEEPGDISLIINNNRIQIVCIVVFVTIKETFDLQSVFSRTTQNVFFANSAIHFFPILSLAYSFYIYHPSLLPFIRTLKPNSAHNILSLNPLASCATWPSFSCQIKIFDKNSMLTRVNAVSGFQCCSIFCNSKSQSLTSVSSTFCTAILASLSALNN
jgi:hypothetical protein